MSLRNSTVLMVPPEGFEFNSETAATNSLQSSIKINNAAKKALDEFALMVSSLREEGIQVLTLEQPKRLPDAVFPNNWFSTHVDARGNNSLIIYPMLTKNRQDEVNIDGLMKVFRETKIVIKEIIDLRNEDHLVLEGTGSLVFDRDNHLVYASLSSRTSSLLVNKVASLLDYIPIIFNSIDSQQQPVYHTNVVMSIAKHYAIVCLESIQDPLQREAIVESLNNSNKIIIPITQKQVQHMCGNVLELFNNKGESILILSNQALSHFNPKQLSTIQLYSKILPASIETIETIGGGSVRCMMAEISCLSY